MIVDVYNQIMKFKGLRTQYERGILNRLGKVNSNNPELDLIQITYCFKYRICLFTLLPRVNVDTFWDCKLLLSQ